MLESFLTRRRLRFFVCLEQRNEHQAKRRSVILTDGEMIENSQASFLHQPGGSVRGERAHFTRLVLGGGSAVSKPNFASKYLLESSRRDLHNALLCTVLESTIENW